MLVEFSKKLKELRVLKEGAARYGRERSEDRPRYALNLCDNGFLFFYKPVVAGKGKSPVMFF